MIIIKIFNNGPICSASAQPMDIIVRVCITVCRVACYRVLVYPRGSVVRDVVVYLLIVQCAGLQARYWVSVCLFFVC